MKFLLFVFAATVFASGCSTMNMLDETEKLFSATFACPKTDEMPAWVEPVELRKMAGVYVLVSDVSDRLASVRGPLEYYYAILDGQWRPYFFEVNGKRYVGESKSELIAKNKVQFTTKHPPFFNSKKEKVKADTRTRTVAINQDGNWVRYADKSDSPVCVRKK